MIKTNDQIVITGRENHGKCGIFSHSRNGVGFITIDKEVRPILMRNIEKSDLQVEIDGFLVIAKIMRYLDMFF